MMSTNFHSAIQPGNLAVVTGGASGIGLAAAARFAALGMNVVIADRDGDRLGAAAAEVTAGAAPDAAVLTVTTDVAQPEQMERLRKVATARFGTPSVLMNNAGIGRNPGLPWADTDGWKALVDVNLWGIVHGVAAFVPAMIAAGTPGLVINTGSKQGITSPPGNAAYNLSKAAVKSYTESLAQAFLAQGYSQISAHLLIPGFTFTGMTGTETRPDAAWTGAQVIAFMLAAIADGDFYILCPDNAVDRTIDARRIQWATDDLIRNRPALSRWHPDHAEAFAAYMRGAV